MPQGRPCPHSITLDDGGHTSEEGNLHYTILSFPCIHEQGHELTGTPHEANVLGWEKNIPWHAVLRWPSSSVIEAGRSQQDKNAGYYEESETTFGLSK